MMFVYNKLQKTKTKTKDSNYFLGGQKVKPYKRKTLKIETK